MGAERWDEQVGTVADEAARLLESLRRTAADASAPEADRPEAGEPGTAPGLGEEHAGAAARGDDRACSDPFCRWCPLCRTSGVLRALSPETLTRLADLAGLAAAVLGDLASARTTDAGRAAAPTPPGRADGDTGRARPIPVRAADDPQEDPRG